MMISNIAAGNTRSVIRPRVCILYRFWPAPPAHAIGEAFRTIKHGYADAVIAGGSEAAVMPLSVAVS
jgi:3-oxoacyl-[acyl-carrier-protein] synthase II